MRLKRIGYRAMTDGIFHSSDSIRSAEPLRHARCAELAGPIELELGGQLPGVTVVYETYGQLNEAKSNAILICHAISGDSHVARHDDSDSAGWWDIAVGPDRPIDTDKYFVICPNLLGGCRGTTGPSTTDPETGKPYGQDFPTITIGDMVDVQKRLVDHLGIETLLAVIGGSMGGHMVLQWAARYPNGAHGAIPMATSHRLNSQALAFDVVARNAILSDPQFHKGQYYDKLAGPDVGLAIARMLGHVTYLSPQSMSEKFEADRLAPRNIPTDFEKKFSVGSYLAHQGAKFVERFDGNSYVTLSMAVDLFDLGATPDALARSLEPSTCRWLVISFTSDWLFPPEQAQEIVEALIDTGKSVSYCNVTSTCGHDAFLLPEDLDSYGELIRAFLSHLNGERDARSDKPGEMSGEHPASIFDPDRLDYDHIAGLTPQGASVLDLGCGDGVLLNILQERGHQRLAGVELNEKAVLAGIRRNLDIVHADLNQGLPWFADKQFDLVVLSQTLQAIRDVELVVSEMLRVGRKCIVSFPNFAYHKLRKSLADNGVAPEACGLLHYKWYNSPNIRFLTIADFELFCQEKSVKIHRMLALDTEADHQVITDDPNLNADLAIFVISD